MTRQQAAGLRQPELALSEPAERDDPLNAVLDLVENTIRTALDLGLGAQIKARLGRMPEMAPEVTALGNRHSASGDEVLALANAKALLADHGRRARTDATRKQHAAVIAGLNTLADCRLPNADCRLKGDQ